MSNCFEFNSCSEYYQNEKSYINNGTSFRFPFAIIFRYAGTIWPMVLPYCILNCVLLTGLGLLKLYYNTTISIMPQGHALMSILIAYLGVSKVNLAYGRYMEARTAIGHGLLILRELNQFAITLTEGDLTPEAQRWRRDMKHGIMQLIDSTVTTLRDGKHAATLALHAGYSEQTSDDPMNLVHALRSHMYHDSLKLTTIELQLLERCKMVDLLHEFTESYRTLLRLASTPLPFALVQMGRTFTFAWTLTIPLVLSGKDFVQEYPSAFTFVLLLTYGFLGLEFVSMILSNPFGDEIKNDLNVKGLGKATIIGIERDSRRLEDEKGTIKSTNLRELVKERHASIRLSGRFTFMGVDATNTTVSKGVGSTEHKTEHQHNIGGSTEAPYMSTMDDTTNYSYYPMT